MLQSRQPGGLSRLVCLYCDEALSHGCLAFRSNAGGCTFSHSDGLITPLLSASARAHVLFLCSSRAICREVHKAAFLSKLRKNDKEKLRYIAKHPK